MMNSAGLSVRETRTEDDPQIREVLVSAFQGTAEANLVERLREDRLVIRELVAVLGGRVVGEILFSRLDLMIDDRSIAAAALAPVAVIPTEQGQGIGSALIVEGLRSLTDDGIEAVIVLGDPSYYLRFGFSRDLTRKLESAYPGETFMALELVAGVLSGTSGVVNYPDAFAAVE